ncbi:MAG: PVC-type heme-binding CxxCH protein, partial [Pirellula sp.]
GSLEDWTATGGAFKQQPVEGDSVALRRADMASQHEGKYWVGSYEKLGDEVQGTLISKPFVVDKPFASFLVGGGGNSNEVRVELVEAASNKVIHRATGRVTENMRLVVVDLASVQGKECFVKLVDEASGGWGHLNFDAFLLHDVAPAAASLSETPLVVDEYPFEGLTAQEAAKAMVVPDGFRVIASAAEPDMLQPIAMALDDRGRVWVAEAYEYPRRAAEGTGRDRILIFEDTDLDGTLDKRKVFAEGLNLVSGLEVGFGGAWVGAAPYLMFIPDRDGDDKADGKPEILLDGWGLQDTHETLNAFIWGPDGWLYGCHGVFTHSNVGKPGAADQDRKPINAGVWRYHPTRHVFEVFAHGTSNPWGVDFNDQGQAFITACVIPHLYHIIDGGRYERQAGNHFNPFTYDDIKTIAEHRHYVGANPHAGNGKSDSAGGGHAHAGAMIYLGDAWPQSYRNQLFMNNIHGQRLNIDVLKAKNSGYTGSYSPDFLLTGDKASQILNLRYAPDGQAWMIDWYDMQACHLTDPGKHDRSNGRIYKIVYGNKKPESVDLTKASDVDLANKMSHRNDWFVRHSRRLLQERAAVRKIDRKAVDVLKSFLKVTNEETTRLRAAWALSCTNELDDATLEMLVKDPSEYVRAWAIQLGFQAKTQPACVKPKRLAELAKSDKS